MKKIIKVTLLTLALTLGITSFINEAEAGNFQDNGKVFIFDHNADNKFDYMLKTDFYPNINKHVYTVSKYLLSTKDNFADLTYMPANKIVNNSRVILTFAKKKGAIYSGGEAFSIIFYEKPDPSRRVFLLINLNAISSDLSTYFDLENQVALRESLIMVFGKKDGYSIYANIYYTVIDNKKGKIKDGKINKKIAGYKVEISNYSNQHYINIRF